MWGVVKEVIVLIYQINYLLFMRPLGLLDLPTHRAVTNILAITSQDILLLSTILPYKVEVLTLTVTCLCATQTEGLVQLVTCIAQFRLRVWPIRRNIIRFYDRCHFI